MNKILKEDYFFCQIILSLVSREKGIDPAKLYKHKLSPQM